MRNFVYWWTVLVFLCFGFSQGIEETYPVNIGNDLHYDAIKLLSETVESKIKLNLPQDKHALAMVQDRIDSDLNSTEKPGKNLVEALKEDLEITPDKMPIATEITDAWDQKAFDESIFGIATSIVTSPTVKFWGGWGLFVFLCWHGYL